MNRLSSFKSVIPSKQSYVMEYKAGHRGNDRMGGLPTHSPYNWPRCHSCHSRMAFIAQIYTCQWFHLEGLMCLQFYICEDDCGDQPFVHLECVHQGAPLNTANEGRVHPRQPKLTIQFWRYEDPLDQTGYGRGDNLPNGFFKDFDYLFSDKLCGLFPIDGSEGPPLSKLNRCIGQMNWPVVPGMLYLYHHNQFGPYLFLYA